MWASNWSLPGLFAPFLQPCYNGEPLFGDKKGVPSLVLTNLLDLNHILTMVILLLTSMPVHEWAHAWAAFQLGDDTAAQRGRLTLNPLAHMDPIGTITLVLFRFGWGKPVPVNPYLLRGNRRASFALVSAAGPLSNLVLALLAAIPFRMGWVNLFQIGDFIISPQQVLSSFIVINLSLMLFNLIPLPPLDGSRILAWLLPPKWAGVMDQLEQYGSFALMMFILLLSRSGVLGRVINPAMNFLLGAMLGY